MSRATVEVLRALAEGVRYGFDMMDKTGLPSGTVYPILARLEARGLIASQWEDPEEHRREGRPARKYYRITPEGHETLTAELARFRKLGQPLPVRT